MPHFSVVKKLEMPHYSYLILEMGKMGHFNNFSYRKTGHFEKRHVISFNEKTRNEPKMELFEFGVFKKMHMASREKYIFHMLFGAFHDTPRT